MSLRNGRSKQACFQGENRRPGIAALSRAQANRLVVPGLQSLVPARGISARLPATALAKLSRGSRQGKRGTPRQVRVEAQLASRRHPQGAREVRIRNLL